jgi:hypothetical protein
MPQDGLPFEFFVKVEATDQAGNVGLDQISKPVKVDLALPRAKVLGVEAALPTPP